MSYYASILKGNRGGPAVGPFRRHGDAFRAADALHAFIWANRHRDRGALWWAVGTCRDKKAHQPGRYNHYVGAELGEDGFVLPESIAPAKIWAPRYQPRTGSFIGRRGGDPLRYSQQLRRAA